MSEAVIKGWCPGAFHPMMSGDGLVVRIRPFFGELDAEQVEGLCHVAEAFGNGIIDLTSRANFQIRGVKEESHRNLLDRLDDIGLLDSDATIEGRRNILMPPDWVAGDQTHRLYTAILEALHLLPGLPQKMGIAIDTGSSACLAKGSADFRIEFDDRGALLLRADGSAMGRPISENGAAQAIIEMAEWFEQSGGQAHGRMARHLAHTKVPADWSIVSPREIPDGTPAIASEFGHSLGVPFGKIEGKSLRALMARTGASHLRPMLNRMLLLKGGKAVEAKGFVSPSDRLMQVHACPGAPHCAQSTVATLELAKELAKQTNGSLHVSGCAKGCAFPRPADNTLVGRNGRFDLISKGRPWDAPRQRGIDPCELSKMANLT